MNNAKPLTRVRPTTGTETLMTSNKVLKFKNQPRRATDQRAYLLAAIERTLPRTDQLGKQVGILRRFLRHADTDKTFSKVEAQRIFDLLKAVQIRDHPPAVKWVAPGRKIGSELSATASFAKSIGSVLSIMPMSGSLNDPWSRDRDALTNDTARIAGDAWAVILRQSHDRRRQKDQ